MKHTRKPLRVRALCLLLSLLALPFLPACGIRVYESEIPDGFYPTVLNEGEDPVNLYFSHSRPINGDSLGLSTISKEVYRLYKDPDKELPYFALPDKKFDDAAVVWRQHRDEGSYISPGQTLYAEWRTKQYDLVFYNTERYATLLHPTSHDQRPYTDISFGSYITYPDYAPEGYRLVGWFSEDLSVQYTDGATPRQSYSTINEAFFPNGEICSAIRFRPKFEPIAED